MRAILRFAIAALLTAGLALWPTLAAAQTFPQSTTNTPASDAIGPRELQNFSLNGTVTRQADTPAAAPSTRTPPRPTTQAPAVASQAGSSTATRRPSSPAPAPTRDVRTEASTVPSLSFDTPPASSPPSLTASATQAPPAEVEPVSTATLAPEQKLALWPWLLLAVVVGVGAALLLWRRRTREAFAGGPEFDDYVAPEPVRPAPRPTPPASPAPHQSTGVVSTRLRAASPPAPRPAPLQPAGIVSTRLRPWLDLTVVPLGCTVDEQQVTVEFEVQVYNSGAAPARDILIEASIFNAGPTQEQDIGTFFGKPAGQGERIQALAPLQSMAIRTALVAPRANIQLFELAGQQVFVPLLAFNALYQWSGGRGQTSASYLLGRKTKTDKLGPLRADLGPKAFTGLEAKLLPTSARK